jgi:hypothetical protein
MKKLLCLLALAALSMGFSSCCKHTSESYRKVTTAQGHVGSPHIGLVPTMSKLVE